jgi:hypothetical protein
MTRLKKRTWLLDWRSSPALSRLQPCKPPALPEVADFGGSGWHEASISFFHSIMRSNDTIAYPFDAPGWRTNLLVQGRQPPATTTRRWPSANIPQGWNMGEALNQSGRKGEP